ncbi:MAG: VOC family protein [Xanthomonadales bacterium]|nr:VOC family protein [Xanthomonadales bacterium]
MRPICKSGFGLVGALLTLAVLARENRDYKDEDWYDAELYPDAPFIRNSSFSQQPIQGRLLRIKRPLVIVSNLERSLEFYVDVVGLEVYEIAPYYNRDPQSLGYQLFNVPVGARKRMATLNTSDEVRGLTIQEIKDMEFEFTGTPRAFTILFETDDLVGIRARAAAGGFNVVEPVIVEIPATNVAPRLRFMEFGIIDPDNHVVSFFQYFDSDEQWAEAHRLYQAIVKGGTQLESDPQ